MPTFTAIALDSLLEPGHSKSMVTARNVPDPRIDKRSSAPPNSRYNDRRRSASSTNLDSKSSAPTIGLDQRNSNPAIPIDRQHHRTGISPALYATPQSTPLPDSPSSYPPSPYIINHKRRGPRLLKCMSHDNVAVHQCATDGKEVETAIDAEKHAVTAHGDDGLVPKEDNSVKDYNLSVTADKPGKEDPKSDTSAEKNSVLNLDCSSASENGIRTSMAFDLQRNSEVGNFLDPQDSMSIKSNADSKNNGGLVHSFSSSLHIAEFYDAFEEISSDNEQQPVTRDVEAELSEIKFSLLEEIEKQKQAEEALNHMRMQWQRIREQLLPIGLTLPAVPVTVEVDRHLDDAVKNMIEQLYVVRFVSNSIGRGMAKAEAEEEMEGQIELKNFEIARLWDKLHYYEAVNREMSQRNQEAVDTARRLRQRRKRMVRWIWGSVAASLTIGSAVLAWSYISAGRGSSYSGQSETSDSGSVTQRN
nr:uncharacterized protein LOC109177609 [Ipomoea batatas]